MKKLVYCVLYIMFSLSAVSQRISLPGINGTADTLQPGFSLIHTGEYAAYGIMEEMSSLRRLSVADTTLQVLNRKAMGDENLRISGSGVVGMPRGSYGFAKGLIILYTSGATSSGTITGSGSVGTGTSPASVGALGPGTGVNGKNPYAGPGMRGSILQSQERLLPSDRGREMILPHL